MYLVDGHCEELSPSPDAFGGLFALLNRAGVIGCFVAVVVSDTFASVEYFAARVHDLAVSENLRRMRGGLTYGVID